MNQSDIFIWDQNRQKCCGYLNKKASKGTFSKGKWQKRWFLIEVNIGDDENYKIEYSHGPNDQDAKQSFPLSGASVKIVAETDFVLTFFNSTLLALSADSPELLKKWVQTLEKIILISNLRDRAAKEGGAEEVIKEEEKAIDEIDGVRRTKADGYILVAKSIGSQRPTMRIKMNMKDIILGSKERNRFEEKFRRDIASTISIDVDMVEIIAVRAYPGMVDSAIMVEFDINLTNADLGEIEKDPDHSDLAHRQEVRSKLLQLLHEMLIDTSSTLYHGFLGTAIDPTFSANLIDSDETDHPVTENFISSDAKITQILVKYKDVVVPRTFQDKTHFNIILRYDGREAILAVPNPSVLPQKYCALWPFEVKQALGFINTSLEQWVEPLELSPKDLISKSRSPPIKFSPSIRCNGEKVINTIHLNADEVYEVVCQDLRDEAIKALSPQDMESIKTTFALFDHDRNGKISKMELEELIRNRTMERRSEVEAKFQNFITDIIVEDELVAAEANKALFMQQISDAQTKMIKMMEGADLNGDGLISFSEFLLMEAWWLNCTINPQRAHLF